MVTASIQPDVGALLREWRTRRRRTQLDLALDAGISARHLSFVETGRSKPGRDLLLRIVEQLDLPFRDRNRLLLAAGHAPAFPERPLDDPALAPVREAFELILRGHEPYPAIVVDRSWNLVAANAAVQALASSVEIDPALLAPPVNVLRATLHPRGLRPLVVNPAEWLAYIRDRLAHQVTTFGDSALEALLKEAESEGGAAGEAGGPLGPLKIRAPDGAELSFFAMFAGMATPFEVTTSELAVELLFPADAATRAAMEGLDLSASTGANMRQ